MQKDMEQLYSRTNIQKAINHEILEAEGIEDILERGVELLQTYTNTTYSYDTKNERVAQFAMLNHKEIIVNVLSVVLLLDQETLYTNVIGQLAAKLGFSDKGDGIKTIAEVVAVLSELDLYDITKRDHQASLMIKSRVTLDSKITDLIQLTKYLPPMLCPPRKVDTNYSSGHLTIRDSLILGKGNFHEEEICLDSLNRFNRIPLSLNVDLMTTYSEPPLDFDTPEKCAKWQHLHPGESWELELEKRIDNWTKFVQLSYATARTIIRKGNKFYFTNKTDTRGRTYSQGYHVNIQANSFRKACIEFKDEEIIEGF